MKLPILDRAVVDIAKLRDYCLHVNHARGRHKARMFASRRGLSNVDAVELQQAMKRIQLLDVVALTEDLPEHGLVRGQVGTVVEELPPDAHEVEFSDDQGWTYASAGVPRDKLIVLRYQPVVAA